MCGKKSTSKAALANFLVTVLSLGFSVVAVLHHMTGQKIVENEIKKVEVEEWRPYPGAQTLALAHPAREIMFGGARGPGKATCLESVVYTPFGPRKMGDISIGSLVSNPDGTVATVIGVYPQGVQDLYRVTTIDGGSVLATKDHLWNARLTCRKLKAERRYLDGDPVNWKVYTTAQLMTHIAAQENIKQPSGVLIPLTAPVEFTRPSATRWGEAIAIDPYVLGVLIGDGCFRGKTLAFASADPEIVTAVKARTGLSISTHANISHHLLGAKSLVCELNRYRLWDHLAPDKFIPDAYKFSPITVRRELLQGLMDTDGTVDSGGWCSFCSVSPQLASDVQWVARSLGYKATITQKQGSYRNDAGDRVECRIAYNIYIQGPNTRDLFKLTRKRDRCKDDFNGGVSDPARRIVSIEPEGRGEAQCIAVDHPNSLYITDDFIVTHNSWVQRLWLARMAVQEERPGVLKYPGYKGAIFRYQAVDLRDWHSEAEAFFCGKLGAKPSGQPREYKFPGGPIIRSGHLENGGYIHYVGWEIHKGGIDELTHLPTKHQSETGLPWCPDYQLLVNGSLRLSPDGNPQMFNTGNPGFSGDRWVKHRFIKIMVNGKLIPPRTPFRDPVSGHMRIFINATVFDNPWILQNDPGYVKGLLELPPAKQRAWIYGDWDAFDGQFFDFQKDKHVVEPHDVAGVLPPWAYRWISCDWGYAHTCAVHGFAQGLDKRIHVYRELGFEGKIGSFEVGVEIAKAFFMDISALPDHRMTMYLSHDAFNLVDTNNRRVDGIRAGIQTVLGANSCFILEMSADEKQMAKQDPEAAVKSMNQRRAQSTAEYAITIVQAPKNDEDTFNYMHDLLRAHQVEAKGEPDVAVIQYLRQHPNGELMVANYLNGFQAVDEVVPKILFHTTCPRLIETLPEMTGDENNPEKMKKVDGDDFVDSALYGVSGHRSQQNQMPLAYYVAGQLQEAFAGRTVDVTMAHIMNMKAQADHDALYAPQQPMRLGRYATRHTQGAK